MEAQVKGIRHGFDRTYFIVTWKNAESVDEVMRLLGRTKASVASYAVRLRKQGVELKPFKRGRKKAQPI